MYIMLRIVHLILLLFIPNLASTGPTTSGKIALPKPPGPYVPQLSIEVLRDGSRSADPFNKSSQPPRELVISHFKPILNRKCSQRCTSEYMPPGTAALFDKTFLPSVAPPVFQQLELSGLCCSPKLPSGSGAEGWKQPCYEDAPLLLFSPGLGISRLVYSLIAQYMSSWGFEVVTIDHPYEANIVQFPDGSVAYGSVNESALTPELTSLILDVRVKDVEFVAAALSKNPEARIGLFGHSIGGATAGNVMHANPGHRFPAGINYDGSLYNATSSQGLGEGHKSFMILSASNHSYLSDQSWAAFWNVTDKLTPRDPRWELQLTDSLHITFTDIPLVADVSGLRKLLPSLDDSLLGTIDGTKAIEIMVQYTKAVFDTVFRTGEGAGLLEKPSAMYPEVLFTRTGGHVRGWP